MNGVLVLLYSALIVNVVKAGVCPKYPLISNFNFKRYLGLWYQQDKKQSGWEAPGRCWKSLYMRDPRNGQFKMRMIFENTLTRREEKYDSKLTLLGPEKPSVIQYSIPLTFLDDEFQVLATDYDTFSVEYKCDPNGMLNKQESVFLYTRKKNPSPLVLQRAYAIMHRYGIDIRKLERVDQTCGGLRFNGFTQPEKDEAFNYVPQREFEENQRPHLTNQEAAPSSFYEPEPHPLERRPPPPPHHFQKRPPPPPPPARRSWNWFNW